MEKLIEIGKSGIKVPFLGMGTWAIGGGSWWGDNDDELSVKTIQKAIDLGIKWIDTAPIYGLYHSEDVVGKSKEKEIRSSYQQNVHWSGDMKHQYSIKKLMERKSIVIFQRKVSSRIWIIVF